MIDSPNRTRFTGRPSSGGLMKSYSPSSTRKENTIDRRDEGLARLTSSTGARNDSIRSRKKKMGPICKSRQDQAAVVSAFPLYSAEEDIDLDRQLAKETCSDVKECMWLSSDCTTPSSFFEEYGLFGPCSALENTIPDAKKTTQNGLKEGKEVTCIQSPTSSDASALEATAICSETTESQSCEEPKICDNSSNFLDKTSYLESLVSLDGEDSDLISGRSLELDSLQSLFPSPSSWSSWFAEVLSPRSSVSSQSEHDSDTTLEESDSDEPIFWPLEFKFDWRSERPWNWFSISPRRDITTPSKSVGVKSDSKRVEPEEGCRKEAIEKSVGEGGNFSKKDFRSTDKFPVKKQEFVLDQELPIEMLLGLDEFNGHEGVDLGFDGDLFSLDESLC
ncbi:hypothetical protein CJ030_MR5G003609 [Morella rubra]|uniref:Uncharacterized protein n=1 Tax=Morella rubra TaxID=262757 RepID=A0A6A1VKC8_9ROSI|nr:hypothetical protein CJ030_MR5G003609 [Morella rubra]